MSIVAEFAHDLHAKYPCEKNTATQPVEYLSRSEILTDIHVVIFDIYGTLFNYWKPAFANDNSKQDALLESFGKTIAYFGMEPFLVKMNPDEPPAKTLRDLYHGLIALMHDRALDRKVEYPEVRIEEVWNAIFLMLRRHGYDHAQMHLGTDADFVKCVAYYYNFFSFHRGLYAGVSDALWKLKNQNMTLGIMSNAQFYSTIDLTLYLRDQSNGATEDFTQLFDPDLLFLSCDFGVSKPNPLLFRKLFDYLYEQQILPSQALFVGNDLSIDIRPAIDAGMRTAFFTGDKNSAFFHDSANTVVPDISFSSWDELPRRVQFHSKPV